MATFNQDELRALLQVNNLPLVTIMMPLTSTGSDQRENQTRLRNLLRQAETMIATFDMKPEEITALLAPAQALLDGDSETASPFAGGQGVAMFLTADPNDFRYYVLDYPVEEKVTASDRFTLKGVIPALTMTTKYYILKLAQKEAELLEGDHQKLTPVEVPNLPTSVAEVVGLDTEGRKDGQQSVGASGRPGAPGTQPGLGGEAGSFAGHGAGEEDPKEYIMQFLHRVNDAMHPFLKDKTDPLIVVATETLHPMFKQASTYKHILEPGILGNPTGYTQQTLIEKALEMIAPLGQEAKATAADRYRAGLSKSLASKVPIDVLQAAYMGQIDTLFVASGPEMWGLFDFNTNKHELHNEERPGDVDLLDLAASQTLINHGTVYVVPREEMPEDAPIAAVYRYSLGDANTQANT